METGSDAGGLARGPLRLLTVLRALNEHNGSTVSHLSHVTGIPRPSLYRILHTLCATGYVRRRPDQERYHLTLLVRKLSDGFSDEEWVRSAAMPRLIELQREIIWPAELATFLGDAMYLRETTRKSSPLTIDRRLVGHRVPMLISASGRIYLARCPANEREEILRKLAQSTAPEDALAKDPVWVRGILRETRRNGYGERLSDAAETTSSVAVPIMKGARVLGCIHVAFFGTAATPQEFAARHLDAMNRTAHQIEADLVATATHA